MCEAPAFSGFPKEGLEFLEDLALNNNREWFQPRKGDFQDYVLEPAQDFVFALGERLRTISEGITYDTRTSGSGSILRIYRDIRFSKDKTPYNTHVRMVLWEGKHKKMENPGFFIRVGPTGAAIFVGQHQFPKPLLAAYRDAVVDEESGEALERALALVRDAEEYEIGGDPYKQVPRGYDAEHERAELLKYRGLYAQTRDIKPEIIITPEFVEVCFEHCRNMAPLHQWLVGVVQRFGI